MAPLPVRAVSGRVERAARFRLVLGVSEHGAQILFAVRELTLVAVRALDLLDVLAAHFRLVTRAHRRLRRQWLFLILFLRLWLLLLLLLLLHFARTAASATTLSLATSRFRRHGPLIAAAAVTAAGRGHHVLPPLFYFRGNCARSTLCLRKNKTN